MTRQASDSEIAFAVFRREVKFEQQLNSDYVYGGIINRLSDTWLWINVQRKFAKSKSITQALSNAHQRIRVSDLIFTDWLMRTAEKFLTSESKYLIILNSSLWLPDSFEKAVSLLIEVEPTRIQAVSLWPVTPDASPAVTDTKGVLESTTISNLAFMVTRSAAEQIIIGIKMNPLIVFEDLIQNIDISCHTLPDDSPDRPFHWLDIFNSENLSESELLVSPDNLQDLISQKVPELENPQVHAFISHWFATLNKVEDIEAACLAADYKTTVINTTDSFQARWLNGIPISFFRQVETACRNFDQSMDYLLFITADVVSGEWANFFDYANQVLRLDCVGSFSPTLTHEQFYLGRLENIFSDPNCPLAIVLCNDLIVTYINRSVILEMLDFFDFFNNAEDTFNPIVGYGLVELMTIVTHSQKLVNIRDRSFTLLHPYGKSYDHDKAFNERDVIYRIAERFLNARGKSWSKFDPKQLDFNTEGIFDAIKEFV